LLRVDDVSELKTEYLECRDVGHQWAKQIRWSKTEFVPKLQAGPGLRHRVYRCSQCTSWKEDLIVYNSGARFTPWKYTYADGYLLTRGATRVTRTEIRRIALHAADAVIRKRRRRKAS
jgi:hypothetical protein